MGNSLNNLPECEWFLGVDLITATYIIAVIGILHPFPYIYTFFQIMTPIIIIIWILALAWCGFSIALFIGILKTLAITFEMYVWYTMIFAILMFILMIVLISTAAMEDCCDTETEITWLNITLAAFAMVFYGLVMYMTFVVNTCRMKKIVKKQKI